MRYKKVFCILFVICIFMQMGFTQSVYAQGENPYEWINGACCDLKSNSGIKTEKRAVSEEEYSSNISSGDYFCFENLYFDKLPFFIDLRVGSNKGTNGTVDIYLDSLSGEKLATVNICGTFDSYKTGENFSAEIFYDNMIGTHSIYIRFNNDGMSFHKFRFLADYEYKDAYDWLYPSAEDGITDGGNFGVYTTESVAATVNAQKQSILCFKNYCFNQSTDYAEIILGNTSECGGTVEIRLDSPNGDLLANVDTYGGKDEQNSGRSYIKAIDLAIYRTHDIYIVWKTADVNFYGLKFHKTEETVEEKRKDGFEFVNPHSFDAYSGQMLDYNNTMNANNGFMREYKAEYGHRIAYVMPNLTFLYKNIYFNDVPDKFIIKLGTAKNDFEEKVAVYIDGVKIDSLNTKTPGIYYDNPTEYTVNLNGLIEENTGHNVTVKILKPGVNFYGFQFDKYAQKNGLAHINPQKWDVTNGNLNETGEGGAEVGFRHETNTNGNFVSYTKGGLTLEYHNVYFEKSPDTLTLFIATPEAKGRVSVALTDGTEIGTITTDGKNGSYAKPTPYKVDVSGKIAAGSICDLVVRVVDFGVNYFGMQFAEETELITYDAETKIVTINSTPELAGNLVIAGAYKTGGALSDVLDDTVTYTEGTPQRIDVTEILSGAEKIKVFIWNNYLQLKPVSESEEFEIE